MARSLSMLGWALNEEAIIQVYIDRAGALLASLTGEYEMILIDDGSTDRTWEIATDCQRTRPWLKPYRNEVNRGSGYNTKRAVSLATKQYVFWQTVDWAYDITALMASLPLLDQYDVLQGVRGNALTIGTIFAHRSDNPWKGLVSYVNYRLIRVLFRLPISDYQNVTVYPRALIQATTLETESSFTNAECLLKTWWRGATFKEVSTPFIKREKGKGTGTRPRAIAAAIRDILYWWFRWVVLGRREHAGRGRVAYAMPGDPSRIQVQ
jgi:glycosyltransferase involved in cell wall biosynthesis